MWVVLCSFVSLVFLQDRSALRSNLHLVVPYLQPCREELPATRCTPLMFPLLHLCSARKSQSWRELGKLQVESETLFETFSWRLIVPSYLDACSIGMGKA